MSIIDSAIQNVIVVKLVADVIAKKTGVDVRRLPGFKTLRTFVEPMGFDFEISAREAFISRTEASGLVADLEHRDHYLDTRTWQGFGYTEVTSRENANWPPALHLGFSNRDVKLCNAHLDRDGRVVGSNTAVAGGPSFALYNFDSHPIVKDTKLSVISKGIDLAPFKIRAIKVFDHPFPRGFTFESDHIAAIEAAVQRISDRLSATSPTAVKAPEPFSDKDLIESRVPRQTFREDNTDTLPGRIEGGKTMGRGYREKGSGPRLHIELAAAWGLGNIHIDGFGHSGGDVRDIANHGIYDLFPELPVLRHLYGNTWSITPTLSWTPRGSREGVVLGLGDGPAPLEPIGGATVSVKYSLKW